MGEMNIFDERYWRINKFLMKMVGLWPYQSIVTKIIIRTLFLISINTMFIPQVIRTYYEWGKNFEIVAENLTGIFYFLTIILKYVITFLAESKLQFLYEEIMKDWRLFKIEGELDILKEAANYGRTLTIGYIVYMSLTGMCFSTFPALIPAIMDLVNPLNESRPKYLCYYAEYFIDQREHYYKLLLHTVFCVMCTVFLLVTNDTVYANCVQHVVGLLGVVDYRLVQNFETVDRKKSSKDRDEEIHRNVLGSISLHNKCIDFVNLLQSTYTTCFFITTGTTIMAISLGTVDMMMNLNNIVNFLRIFCAVGGFVIYLFYISMPGQRIIDSSSNIFYSVYNSGWNDFPPKTQQLIKFMMMRCSVPCQFTAGPLLVMNLETCSFVLKTAMSYCTFVISMR